MYSHLQRLELGFFDRQQTGQLMSRVTVDLQAVRFFLGYGLVFILQSALTLVLAGIAMIIINPALGLIAMAPVPFVVFISQRYGRAARPAIQEVQQRIAELTANAEENISGVRVVKSFAREPLQLERFRGQRRPGLRPGDGRHAPGGPLQPDDRLPAADRPRRRAAARRPRRDPRRTQRSASSPPSTST